MNTEREDPSVVCVWQIFCFEPPGEGDQSEADLLFSFTPYLQSYLYQWHRATGATQTISPLTNTHIDTFSSAHTLMWTHHLPSLSFFFFIWLLLSFSQPGLWRANPPTHTVWNPHPLKECSEGELYSFKGSGPSIHVEACFTYQSMNAFLFNLCNKHQPTSVIICLSQNVYRLNYSFVEP